MTIPDVVETVTDGASGASAGTSDNTILIAAVSSVGTVNTLYPITDVSDVRSTIGYGPGPEHVANVLAEGAGKTTVLFLPLANSAGTIGAVTHTGAGAMTVVDNSSAPNDAYEVVIKITTTGALATSTYQVSLDGGKTYNGADIATAASSTILNSDGVSTGIVVTMSNASATKGDTYAFSSTSPSFSTSQYNTGMAAALLEEATWSLHHVVGTPADSAACAALFSAVDVKTQAGVAVHRLFRSFIEGPLGVSDSALETAFAGLFSVQGRVSVVADFAPLVSVLTARSERRPSAWPVLARLAASRVEIDLGDMSKPPLSRTGRLKSNSSDPVAYSYHDERRTPGLDAAGFVTLRTWLGLQGTFCTQGTTRAPVGSDYTLIQYGRVMDKALTIGHTAMVPYSSTPLRTNADGTIDERDAKHIEGQVSALLRDQMGGAISALTFVVNRTDNIQTTKKIRYKVRILALTYAKQIEGDWGFVSALLA